VQHRSSSIAGGSVFNWAFVRIFSAKVNCPGDALLDVKFSNLIYYFVISMKISL